MAERPHISTIDCGTAQPPGLFVLLSDRSLCAPARVFDSFPSPLTAAELQALSVGVANPQRFYPRHQGPSIMGFEDPGGTISTRGLAVKIRPTQADIRTHLIYRPGRDIIPPLGGSQIFLLSGFDSYVLTLRRDLPSSIGIRCHRPRCDA